MQRHEILDLRRREILARAARLYGVDQGGFDLLPGYEGSANLVYQYQRQGRALILRISFRPDRTAQQIQAELHFVTYLAAHGVSVARPLLSQRGSLLETISLRGMPLHLVCFAKGKGMRVPDNGYRYRDDAPIEEYFLNWGRLLGQMHALAKDYLPLGDPIRRPDWFVLHRDKLAIDRQVPAHLPTVRARIRSLLAQIQALPRDRESYGLIHGDFNDGNFTVDYGNGTMTVFDFDDCCYFWFIYELAAAWEGGIGRTMFRGLAERRAFMDHYMEQVLTGYHQENTLPDSCLARLPLFVKLIQVEEFLHFVRYIDDPDPDLQARLAYLIRCIVDDIPYMGFFDPIYSPEKPFSL